MKTSGWGRYPRIEARINTFEKINQLQQIIDQPGSWITYGKGKSYGDSALNRQIISSHRFNKILDFKADAGLVTCECGVTLAELIDIFLPRGWFPAITPGTKQITVGGAIASDVHGKNHHSAGCFSACVVSIDLMLPDGTVAHCSRNENRILFLATCGGMGLTGVILSATIKLSPVKSAFIRETVIRCQNLKEIFTLFKTYQHVPYSVAWINCLAKGDHLGRSVLMLGEHADKGHLKPASTQSWEVPFDFPGFSLNRVSVSLFNTLYYHLQPRYVEKRLTPLDPFFYPLDKISQWNRLYGRKGFTQYQLVLPKQASYEGLQKVLKKIAGAGMGSFLAVLKLFGPTNDNLLSFPMEGYTLALDFKIEPKLFSFLNELDAIVLDHGGRLYLAKDMRMPADVFHKGYPQWEIFAQIRAAYGMDQKFNSLQSRRMGI